MTVTYEGLTFGRPGHATVRVEDGGGTVIYIDPWSEVIENATGDGDVVFVTHDDVDHYDPAAIAAVAASDAIVAAYEAIDTSELDLEVVPLAHEESTTVRGIGVESMPAHNDPEGSHVADDGRPFHAEGKVIGLVLTVEGTTVCYPSDTDFLDHHRELDVDVLMPPIGGHYTMDRHEAAEFARAVAPALVLPVHYDTFEAIEADVGAFAAELARDGIRVEAF